MKKKVIVGISGGPDSMALADILREQDYEPVLVHVNYHKRESADRDEQIVKDYAEKYNLAFEKLDATDPSGNFQDWARKARYEFYLKMAEKYQTDLIALGHHQDDLLETYLIQKKRKIIPEFFGLQSLRKQGRFSFIRPLLGYSKRELERYCLEKGIEFGIDESNLSDIYLRNYIRHHELDDLSPERRKDLLKEIEEKNQALVYIRENIFKDERWMDQEYGWLGLSEILYPLTDKRFSQSQLENDLEILKKAGQVSYKNFDLILEKGKIQAIFKPEWKPAVFKNPEELSNFKEEGPLALQITSGGEKIESFFLQPEDFPVTLRPFKPGDEIEMRFGVKKLSRFFIDRKIPKALRSIWPVIENSKGKVIFCVGLGCDKDHFNPEHAFYLKADLESLRREV